MYPTRVSMYTYHMYVMFKIDVFEMWCWRRVMNVLCVERRMGWCLTTSNKGDSGSICWTCDAGGGMWNGE